MKYAFHQRIPFLGTAVAPIYSASGKPINRVSSFRWQHLFSYRPEETLSLHGHGLIGCAVGPWILRWLIMLSGSFTVSLYSMSENWEPFYPVVDPDDSSAANSGTSHLQWYFTILYFIHRGRPANAIVKRAHSGETAWTHSQFPVSEMRLVADSPLSIYSTKRENKKWSQK